MHLLVVGSSVADMLLRSVGSDVIPGDTSSSPQPVTERSWHGTSSEGMYLQSGAHVNYF